MIQIKVKYPNRTTKHLINTFQFGKFDSMGQALLEQQQAEEMKERVKDYQLHQATHQNDADARTRMQSNREANNLKSQKEQVAVVVAV